MLGGIKDHLKTVKCSRCIVFIGCGTRYNAALAVRPILKELSGIPVTMEIAIDLLDRQCPIYREDTAVLVSQFGETADTLQALEYALENGALCVGITNTVSTAIARNTHCGVHINAGAEIGAASTKACTSQIVVMAMLAVAIAHDTFSKQPRQEAIIDDLFELPSVLSFQENRGKIKGIRKSSAFSHAFVDFSKNFWFADKVREVLELDQEMTDLARQLMEEQSPLVFGRGYNYATTLEGALQEEQSPLVFGRGYNYATTLEGALQEEQSPLVFGRGYNYATTLEGALQVKEVALMHSEVGGEMRHVH